MAFRIHVTCSVLHLTSFTFKLCVNWFFNAFQGNENQKLIEKFFFSNFNETYVNKNRKCKISILTIHEYCQRLKVYSLLTVWKICPFQYLKQNIADHKPVVDRLNKTGSALLMLAGGDDSERLQSLIDDDNTRFDAVKNSARERSNSLDEALQQAAEVTTHLLFSFCNIFIA